VSAAAGRADPPVGRTTAFRGQMGLPLTLLLLAPLAMLLAWAFFLPIGRLLLTSVTEPVPSLGTPALLGGPRTLMIATLISQQATDLLDWPFAGAISTVLLVISVGTTVAFKRVVAHD